MSSERAASAASTPPTSPETQNGGPTSAMEAEEARMAKERQEQDEKWDRDMAAKRKQDLDGGKEVVDQKYKALEYLLNQSKLYSAIMLEQMTQQEDAEMAKDEKSKKRAEKREEQAEKAAQVSQKRSTRGAATQDAENAVEDTTSPKKSLPRRGRATKSVGSGEKSSE